MRWASKHDLITIAALLIAALLLLIIRGGAEPGTGFEILSGGNVTYIGALDIDRPSFFLEENPHVLFTVQNGRIAVTQSDCRDKTCVRTGFINIPGQITACLPHGLVVRITGAGGVDAVV
jgi:hypothetical protein